MLQERHRIDVDCRRTDRSQPMFAEESTPSSDRPGSLHRRYQSMSPNQEEIGAQSPSNEHVERLSGILLTYHFYEKELGKWVFLSVVH